MSGAASARAQPSYGALAVARRAHASGGEKDAVEAGRSQALADLQSSRMLLAGDVGGTKTLVGVFARGAKRPSAVAIRSYPTLDFPDLASLCRQFFRETST